MALYFPAAKQTGQIFVASNGVSYQWDGYKWTTQLRPSYANIGSNPGPNPPLDPTPGTFWWDTKSGQLFTYYADNTSEQWVEASTPHEPLFEPNPPTATIGTVTMTGEASPILGNPYQYTASFTGNAQDVVYNWSTDKSDISNVPSLFTQGAVTGNAYNLLDQDTSTYIEMTGGTSDEFTLSFSETITDVERIAILFSSGNGANVRWNVKPNGSYNFQGDTSSTSGEWFSIPLQEDIDNIRVIMLSDATTVLRCHLIGFGPNDEGYLLTPRDVISNRNAENPSITFYSSGNNRVLLEITSLTSSDSPKNEILPVVVG